MFRDQRAAEVLCDHIDETLVLDDPGKEVSFRDVQISDLCIEYGDGIIDPIITCVNADLDQEIGQEKMKVYVRVLKRACGDSTVDREFLNLYLERRARELREAPSLKLLRAELARN
jgi:hypothetical protein